VKANFDYGRGRDEGSFVSQEDLFEVQDCAPWWRGEGDLRESEAQAAAGMISKSENRNSKIGTRKLKFENRRSKSEARKSGLEIRALKSEISNFKSLSLWQFFRCFRFSNLGLRVLSIA